MNKRSLDIERQLRAWAEDVGNSIPVFRTPESVGLGSPPPPHTQRRRALVAALVTISVSAVASLWYARAAPSSRVAAGLPASGVGNVTVVHESVAYRQEAQLTCADAPLSRSGAFNSMTIDTWGDAAGELWRNRVTYPDGTYRDLLVIGEPSRPREVLSSGEAKGDVLGCVVDGNGILVAEPGQGSLYSLNLGRSARSNGGAPLSPGYAELGMRVPGSFADSEGRQAELWRQRVTGFAEFDGGRHPLVQTTEWFVESGTGRVLETRYVNQVQSLGLAQWTATLIESETSSVPKAVFDRSGYEPVR